MQTLKLQNILQNTINTQKYQRHQKQGKSEELPQTRLRLRRHEDYNAVWVSPGKEKKHYGQLVKSELSIASLTVTNVAQ